MAHWECLEPVGNKHTPVAADQAFAQAVMICLGGINAATDEPRMCAACPPAVCGSNRTAGTGSIHEWLMIVSRSVNDLAVQAIFAALEA